MNNFFEFQHKQIHYKVEGRGKTIVLLHGFLENLHIWDSYSHSMKEEFRVISMDLPGHGETENLAEVHSMELMADCVFELLKLLNVTECVLVGHSMGGYVAMAFARKYSAFLRGLVLFHSHAGADSPEAKINRGRTIQIVKENHKDFITYFIPELFTEKNRKLYPTKIDELQTAARSLNKNAIIAALSGMRERQDSLDLLKKANFPVFFIIGKQDSRTPMELMQHQIILPKISEILLLEEVAHMGFIEAEDYCLESLRGFVRKVNNI